MIFYIDQVSTNPLSKAHDNLAYDHTSFDPQVGGVLFQGKNVKSLKWLKNMLSLKYIFSLRDFRNIFIVLGSNLSSTVSTRYLDRSNEVLDYIDCISNEDVPFEIPSTNSKENDDELKKDNEVPSETPKSSDGTNVEKLNDLNKGMRCKFNILSLFYILHYQNQRFD